MSAGIGIFDSFGSGMFWFTLVAGWSGGVLTAALLYIPYRNYRLDRMVKQSDVEVERITAGFHQGRHAAPVDLEDAAGAFKAATEANARQSIYPGPHREPTPAWVSWIEEHGQYTPARPPDEPSTHDGQPDQDEQKIPRHRALFLVAFIALAAVWHVGQWYQHLADLTWRATSVPRYAYQVLWAVGVSVVHHHPTPIPVMSRRSLQSQIRPKRHYVLAPR